MRRDKVFGRSLSCLVLIGVLMGLVLGIGGARGTAALAPAQEPVPAAGNQSAAGPVIPRAYLPLVLRDYGPRSSRLGYCALSPRIDRYGAVRQLSAGWYVRFGVEDAAPRPLGMDHVQVVRIHQLTTCWPERKRDRAVCPYVNPRDYVITSPDSTSVADGLAKIATVASTNRGMLWFIGNEMDRRDWDGGGQDEMLPELYARAYHEIYHAIKAADPTATVGIGGMVQTTGLRLEYLTKVWNHYWYLYGTAIPVDVWNVHNFIFREYWNEYGADIPPGSSEPIGAMYMDEQQNDMKVFEDQIRLFRQWMKDHGQQQKPLIVSEYGIVYRHANLNKLNVVQSFMIQTFDYFMNTKDCSLGYDDDQCRLVQRWAWYSLDDNNPMFNDFAYLIDPNTGALTATGQTFAEYAGRYLDVR
ncbi:MAG: hypothetical protein RBT75_03435 [Anaerolineae bacterium]|nr:hypothetical protein [Anaerolineae bacterium]